MAKARPSKKIDLAKPLASGTLDEIKPIARKGTSLILLFFLSLTSCGWHPCTTAYHAQYSYLNEPLPSASIQSSNCFLVILVSARHLDYSSGTGLLKTVSKHPSDGTKDSDVGHAWILLQKGDCILEGGHSGELGCFQPRYFEGVMYRLRRGDDNPISYLWEVQKDGFFQKGSGGFAPSFAAKLDLTEEQYQAICNAIDPSHYDYSNYSIVGNQCVSFVTYVASIVGLNLECEVVVPLEPRISLGRYSYTMWSDPDYREISFSSPDILEKSLRRAVREGRADNALAWYRKERRQRRSLGCCLKEVLNTLLCFPSRYSRARLLRKLESGPST